MMRVTSLRLLRSLLTGALLGLMLLVAHAGPKEDIQDDMKAGRWTQAEERLVVVLEKHPNNPLAHYWRAQVKAKLGDMAAARDELAAAKRIDPSMRFAGSREALAKLESRIAEPQAVQPAVAAASTVALVAPMAAPQAMPEQPVELEAAVGDAVEQTHKTTWFYFTWMVGIMVVVALIASVGGAALDARNEKRSLRDARERWAARLRDAKADLDDAIKKSDGSSDLSPEAKLRNFDRCNGARSNIATLLGTIQTAVDFHDAHLTEVRARDIAAEVRGEETPTARAERRRREAAEREERQRREAAERAERLAASRPREVHHHHDRGSSSSDSLLRDAALIGGGVLLANALTSSAGAKERGSSGWDGHPTFGSGGNAGGGSGLDLGGTVSCGDDSFGASTPSVDASFD